MCKSNNACSNTTVINIRTTREIRDRLDAAAKVDGLRRTDFILRAARIRAIEILTRGAQNERNLPE